MASSGSSSVQYTDAQVAAFEQVYAYCPNPTASQRLQMKSTYPALRDIEDEKITLWFEKRRSGDKHKKTELENQLAKERLVAANAILKAENDNLKNIVRDLLDENDYLVQNRRNMHVQNLD